MSKPSSRGTSRARWGTRTSCRISHRGDLHAAVPRPMVPPCSPSAPFLSRAPRSATYPDFPPATSRKEALSCLAARRRGIDLRRGCPPHPSTWPRTAFSTRMNKHTRGGKHSLRSAALACTGWSSLSAQVRSSLTLRNGLTKKPVTVCTPRPSVIDQTWYSHLIKNCLTELVARHFKVTDIITLLSEQQSRLSMLPQSI